MPLNILSFETWFICTVPSTQNITKYKVKLIYIGELRIKKELDVFYNL